MESASSSFNVSSSDSFSVRCNHFLQLNEEKLRKVKYQGKRTKKKVGTKFSEANRPTVESEASSKKNETKMSSRKCKKTVLSVGWYFYRMIF